MALVGHMSGVAEVSGRAELHVGTAEYVGLNPLPAGCTNVAAVVPADQMSGLRGDPAAFLVRRLAAYPALAARTEDARFESPVRVTGPFAYTSQRITANGALLVGDAAEFFDPFTGEGIYSALRGGALAAEAAAAALHDGGVASAARLAPYRAARRRAFRGKWLVERLIGHALESPRLFDRLVRGLDRQDLGHTLVGVTGNCLPARAVLNWRLLAAMAG
jgi:flavin-dependent dehydrogenase